MRKVKDAIDLNTGEKVYFRGHAQSTYMSDGHNVESKLSDLSSEVSELSERVDELEKGGQGGGASVEGETLVFSATSSAQVIGNTLKL